MAILALNCGSSSVKFALFDQHLNRLGDGMVEGTGGACIADVMRRIGAWQPRIQAVGHRVVHGGTFFSAPVVITAQVRATIEGLTPLAPEHQPHHVAGIDAITKLLPASPQVACFDTAFHRSIPNIRQHMALPKSFAEQGLLRYGFHGLSCEYVSAQYPAARLVICHLGNGCSVTGVDKGKSQYTSMGFTPADGLMMGTRSGSLDPGAVLWLVEELGSVDAVRTLINRESGLKGVSGLSPDMRTLLASADPQARFAVEMFVDRLVLEIGRAAAAMGGFDVVVLTGGIGENAEPIRSAVMGRLAWLGVADRPGGGRYMAVVKADEEQVIAKSVLAVVGDAIRPGSSAG